MPEVGPSADQVSTQLKKILESPLFEGAERRSRFLRYAVEQTLQGHARDLKEYTVALEVFDRSGRFDSDGDSIVRVEALKLRASLDKYYATVGAQDVLVIRIPKGSYGASFAWREAPKLPLEVPPTEVRPATTAKAAARTADLWRRFGISASAAVLVLLAVFAASSRWHPPRDISSPSEVLANSVAVLPFRSLSGEKADEYFADGLTDQLIHSLGELRELRVIAPSSSMQFKSQAQDLHRVGQVLGASVVIEGSVQRVNGQVRIK